MRSTELARRVLAALDLTCLDDAAPPSRIADLCRAAITPHGAVAAVCIYPEYIRSAREWLDAAGAPAVRIATVVNFPDGRFEAACAGRETLRAVAAGADEVDVVLPWRAVLDGEAAVAESLVAACRDACGDRAKLKVILETGELGSAGAIAEASRIAIRAGADFIKTSTGKVPVNATPSAADVMLQVIAETGGQCGFKAAGGIRRVEEAAVYFELADDLLGPEWATPERFRLGASSLLDDVLACLAGSEASHAEGY